MPITRKVRDEEAQESEGENGERRFTSFMLKARWFAISQTSDEFTPPLAGGSRASLSSPRH
jgi:hypothetical protein